eukprot:GILK01000615.1.p1 GENE.GILK01000615.1~~GILK01000615.1.p1  ORF type:complete len:253 (+),score=34.51 GILK01000615.1:42-761(+)
MKAVLGLVCALLLCNYARASCQGTAQTTVPEGATTTQLCSKRNSVPACSSFTTYELCAVTRKDVDPDFVKWCQLPKAATYSACCEWSAESNSCGVFQLDGQQTLCQGQVVYAPDPTCSDREQFEFNTISVSAVKWSDVYNTASATPSSNTGSNTASGTGNTNSAPQGAATAASASNNGQQGASSAPNSAAVATNTASQTQGQSQGQTQGAAAPQSAGTQQAASGTTSVPTQASVQSAHH